MTLPDVNVLLGAHRSDSPSHALCLDWLQRTVDGPAAYGVSPQVLASVVRVATHPKIFVRPSSLDDALAFAAAVMNGASASLVVPGRRHWAIFEGLCRASDARGNLVQDAWLAALAIEWGCEWITLDRDFARFPGLRWRPPG